MHNFVNDEEHVSNLVREKMNLFINYLNVFNIYHERYFNRYNLRVKLMYGQIEQDIKLELPCENIESRKNSVFINESEAQQLRRCARQDTCVNLNSIISTISDQSSNETEKEIPNLTINNLDDLKYYKEDENDDVVSSSSIELSSDISPNSEEYNKINKCVFKKSPINKISKFVVTNLKFLSLL